MFGEYSLAKVVTRVRDDGTVAHPFFGAYVSVNAQLSVEQNNVIHAIGQQINKSLGEVNAETHSDWINAAIEGVKDTLNYLEKLPQSKSYLVKIVKVVGTEVDTTEDAVRVAAAIATWRAVHPNSLDPKPTFNQFWFVDFPPIK